MGQVVTLFLCGDVMTGRGIDQVLPHPGDPRLFEPWVDSAAAYVRLAERANGPIPRRVGPDHVWGDALAELQRMRPRARIANLETAITTCGDAWPDKGIHYRMHPANLAALAAAGLDCCVRANNHVIDWGRAGLDETIRTLRAAGCRAAGAGADLALMCFRRFELPGGRLAAMSLSPMRRRRFRLERASATDACWLAETLAREGRALGTRVRLEADARLELDRDLAG